MKKNSASTIFFDKSCDLILCITAEYDLCGSIILEILHDVIVCLRKYTNNRTFFQKNHAALHQVIKNVLPMPFLQSMPDLPAIWEKTPHKERNCLSASGAYLTIVELEFQFADEARDFSRALNPCS